MRYLNKTMILKINLTIIFLIVFLNTSVFAEVKTQFVPSVSITEKYTDNYNKTANNKEDESSTIYSPGISFGLIGKNASMFFNYNPVYTDYTDHSENDSWSHPVAFNGQVQMSKYTSLTLSENFSRSLDQTIRTNSWEKHDTSTTTAGLRHEFGKRDYISLGYSYSFDNYDTANADEFEKHNPSISLSYWFGSNYGMDLGGAYQTTEYDISNNDTETWSGNIKFLKKVNKHFDMYLSYAHTYTDQTSGDHSVYHPSLGFDWRPTDDSGVSIGAGVLFHEWSAQASEDSESLFVDLDMYKNFDFSRRGTFSLTGSSGYDSNDDDAASLGFHLYYQVGFLLSYKMTKRLTGELNGSYTINQYDDSAVGSDRDDKTLGLGANLSWAPLKWLSFNLSYSFNDYDTDAAIREDYQENIGIFTITITPFQNEKFSSPDQRADLEEKLFD